MLRARGHHDELARADIDALVAELHAEAPSVNEEQLRLARVLVPVERTEEPHRLHLLSIQLRDHHR